MTPENFCYWLQGYFEISGTGPEPLASLQVEEIKNHLSLVLNKKTPDTSVYKISTNPFTFTNELMGYSNTKYILPATS
jgi:hypothetical protein